MPGFLYMPSSLPLLLDGNIAPRLLRVKEKDRRPASKMFFAFRQDGVIIITGHIVEVYMDMAMHVHTPLGTMLAVDRDGRLAQLDFVNKIPEGMTPQPTPLLRRCQEQLDEYFAGHRHSFDLPLAPEGTAFQQAVWAALVAIPYGQTRSYAQIAQAVGRPKAVRAVGGANHRNPIAIIQPCHRVIGADGSLTGYGGGIERKQQLLQLEGVLS